MMEGSDVEAPVAWKHDSEMRQQRIKGASPLSMHIVARDYVSETTVAISMKQMPAWRTLGA